MPIENSELDRFGDVHRLDHANPRQVGDCARHSQDSYVRSCRQPEPIVSRLEQPFSLGIELTPALRLTSVDPRVQSPGAYSIALSAAGGGYPRPNDGCRLARGFTHQVPKRDRTNADMKVDSIE
jgi:hypothetical protein